MLNNNIKILFKSIITISIVIMLFSCENDIKIDKSLQIEDQAPKSTTYNSESIITDSGHVKVIMKSPQVEHYIIDNDNYLELPKGIDVKFYDTSGTISSTITANYAKSDQVSLIVVAKNNVIATNSVGQKLYTEKLIWDQKKHIIYTDEKVKVVKDKQVLFGTGLEANEEFDDWTILNPSGEILLSEEDSVNNP